ncbi:hypothetical protein SLA2020_219680 [Shorea laevis]
MIFLSYNIRGLGGKEKRGEIRKLVLKEKVDMLFIQETKLSSVSRSLCRELWGSDDFDWIYKFAEGMSGRLLCIWCSKSFRKEKMFQGVGFIGVSGFWVEENIHCYFVNVYSPCDLANKRQLWEELGNFIRNWKGNWCVGGDFNAVKSINERKGCRTAQAEVSDFASFIKGNNLVDLPLIGRRYTWYQPNGVTMSHLDRFLFSKEWMVRWEGMKQWGLCRGVSDHCPILVKCNVMDWGHKPFRFFDAWLSAIDFKEMFSKNWSSIQVDGWAGYRLKEKLKRMKEVLKRWSRDQFRGLDSKIDSIRDEIAALDLKGESQQLSVEEIELKKDKLLELGTHLQNRENMLRQKSRKNWLKEGDENSKFFHQCVKERWRRNEINCVQVDGKNLEEAVWETIKDDVIQFVVEFQKNGRLVKGSNASFIVLIPKKENPVRIGDYRLISLISCMYKVIAKLLANRLRRVLDRVIGKQQSAFIGGRQLMDSVMVANETIDEVKKKKRCIIFKVDFEKAYDKVCWDFLMSMMEKMGFCVTWRNWILECLRTNSISVLVNGSPTKEFSMSRGLRQGDPLSPPLFLIVAEGLNGIIQSTLDKKQFNGVQIGRRDFCVSHLQYADDTIIFAEAKEQNVWAFKCIMRIFELVLGLK